MARFLEHAQQIELNYKNNVVVEKVSRERTKRVLEQLAHLKENISTSALESLKKTFEFNKELQGTAQLISDFTPMIKIYLLIRGLYSCIDF